MIKITKFINQNEKEIFKKPQGLFMLFTYTIN